MTNKIENKLPIKWSIKSLQNQEVPKKNSLFLLEKSNAPQKAQSANNSQTKNFYSRRGIFFQRNAIKYYLAGVKVNQGVL
jgi:hypothetical protein